MVGELLSPVAISFHLALACCSAGFWPTKNLTSLRNGLFLADVCKSFGLATDREVCDLHGATRYICSVAFFWPKVFVLHAIWTTFYSNAYVYSFSTLPGDHKKPQNKLLINCEPKFVEQTQV